MRIQSLKLLRQKVMGGGVHLQENSLFDLYLGIEVTQNVTQYPLDHVTYSATKFEVATSNNLGGDTFTRKYIIWQGHTEFYQYPLHHVTYSATKSEVATSNGLGGDTFTRKYNI